MEYVGKNVRAQQHMQMVLTLARKWRHLHTWKQYVLLRSLRSRPSEPSFATRPFTVKEFTRCFGIALIRFPLVQNISSHNPLLSAHV